MVPFVVFLGSLAAVVQEPHIRTDCGEPFVNHEEAAEDCIRRTYVRDAALVRCPNELDPLVLAVTWEQPEVQAGRFRHWNDQIVLRGRIERANAGADEPFASWFQGIAMLLAREPGDALDWMHADQRRGAIWLQGLACPNGAFQFAVRVTDIQRAPESGGFPVALLLAKHLGNEVVWCLGDPVIPSNRPTLAIPGPPTLEETQRILNRVASPEVDAHDPLALIRCVNALLPLGKERALAVLRRWASMVGHRSWPSRSRGEQAMDSLDFADEQTIPLIAAALFVARESGHAFPSTPDVQVWPDLTSEEASNWPAFPLIVHEGMPLLMPIRRQINWTHFGDPPAPQYWPNTDVAGFLWWCDRNAELRSSLLRPPDDPLASLDRFLAEPLVRGYLERFAKDGGFGDAVEDSIGKLRAQVLRLTSSALSDETRAILPWEWAGQDRRWARTQERLFALRIHWEPAVGDYCVDE